MITLYLKTHNKTGRKYLGKTVQDPYKYRGSGIHWDRHLKKHGNDVTTEVLFQTEDEEEFKGVGLYYSKLWNIVESDDFLNFTNEEGQGGYTSYTAERNEKISKALSGCEGNMKGKRHSDKTKKKMSETWKRKKSEGYVPPPMTEETKEKMSESQKGREAWNKNKEGCFSKETTDRMSEKRKGIPKPKVKCPHCNNMVPIHLKNRWHFDNCKHKK